MSCFSLLQDHSPAETATNQVNIMLIPQLQTTSLQKKIQLSPFGNKVTVRPFSILTVHSCYLSLYAEEHGLPWDLLQELC